MPIPFLDRIPFFATLADRRNGKVLDDFYEKVLREHPVTSTGLPPPIDIRVSEQTVTTPRLGPLEEEEEIPASDRTTFGPPPIGLDSINPNNGKLAGGDTIDINATAGTVFLSTAEVRFDGVLATGVTVISPTLLRCTTPAHIVSTDGVDVKVTNVPGDDSTSDSLTKVFKYYDAPVITGVTGGFAPGDFVYIDGLNFYFGTGYIISFNGIPTTGGGPTGSPVGPANNRYFTQLLAQIPGGVSGSVLDIVVTNHDADLQQSNHFSAEDIASYTITGPTSTSANVFYHYTFQAIRRDLTPSTTYNGTAKLTIYVPTVTPVDTGVPEPSVGSVTWTPVSIPVVNGVGSFDMSSVPYRHPVLGGSATSGDFYATAVDHSFTPPLNYVGPGFVQVHVTQTP